MNNTRIIISVIIPTYQTQSYIFKCLDSLCEQTLSSLKYEVIIILNGDREPYYKQISNYIDSHRERITLKLLYAKQSGVSNARNLGLQHSTGDYICFIDDDDYISSTYLEELYACSSDKTVGISNTISFEDETGLQDDSYAMHKVFLKNQNHRKYNILHARKFFSGPCMKLIHRDIIGDRRFDCHYKNGEDSLFMFLISDKIQNVSFTSENAIYYRRYRANSAVTSSKTFYSKLKNRFKLILDYTLIFVLHPFKYNIVFYLTRIVAGIHYLFSKK